MRGGGRGRLGRNEIGEGKAFKRPVGRQRHAGVHQELVVCEESVGQVAAPQGHAVL